MTHPLPRWIRECFFFFFVPCFPSCLPKKKREQNTPELRLYNRRCSCIKTGSKHTQRKRKKKKKVASKLWRASLFIAAISSILLRPRRPSPDLQNGTRSAVRLVPLCRQIISAARSDAARRAEVRPAHDSRFRSWNDWKVDATFISRNLLNWVIEFRPICVFVFVLRSS